MLRPRITPCLLVSEGGLIKTVKFKDAKYVGDPINAVKIFNEKEADELIILDIDSSAKGQEPDYAAISHFAMECRMPLCYGGGIKSAEQAKRIIGLGVEKVAVSSAFIDTPHLISEMAEEIGSQSVVVVLDVRKRLFGGGYDVFVGNGRINTKQSAADLARKAEALGAGEIVINAIESDGVMKGYDLALARHMRQQTNLPMSVLGGAGSLEDMQELIAACGIVGAAAGSLFVFKGAYRAVLINYPNPAQKDDMIRSALGV
jgi:cyclase